MDKLLEIRGMIQRISAANRQRVQTVMVMGFLRRVVIVVHWIAMTSMLRLIQVQLRSAMTSSIMIVT